MPACRPCMPNHESAMSQPAPIEIDPAGEHSHSIIWLHGLGADGNDFLPIVQELALPARLGLRFVFPNAPEMPVTINGGYVMPAWYDIRHPDLMRDTDEEGIARSTGYLLGLMQAEQARGIPAGRIILAGFSQGGVIALRAALAAREKPLGVLALSTYLPDSTPDAGGGLNIFQGHGSQDEIVPLAAATATRDRLAALGHQVSWHQYTMAHSVCLQEIGDIRDWLLETCR